MRDVGKGRRGVRRRGEGLCPGFVPLRKYPFYGFKFNEELNLIRSLSKENITFIQYVLH